MPGVPRSSEYESVLEQDPFGDKHETGGNDDIWGEWGLDKDAPFLSTLQALGLWGVGMTCLFVTYKTALANAPKPVAVCYASRQRARAIAEALPARAVHGGGFEQIILVPNARVTPCTPDTGVLLTLVCMHSVSVACLPQAPREGVWGVASECLDRASQ